jgi:hypothetical protein
MKSYYAKLTAALIAIWFTFALSASALHLFQNNSNRVGLAVGLAALLPIAIFALWFAASNGFRQFALSLNPRALTYIQSWRIIGITFVILEARGVLPAIFALPAGYGDIFIGATASLVAWKLANPSNRTSFIAWQALGITDLVNAVTLGTTAPLLYPHGVPTAPMTFLPLSLIPTFLVPLFLIFHVICIAQARAWTTVPRAASQSAAPIKNFATH